MLPLYKQIKLASYESSLGRKTLSRKTMLNNKQVINIWVEIFILILWSFV